MKSSPVRYERNDAQPSQSYFGEPSTSKRSARADIVPTAMDEQCRHEMQDMQSSLGPSNYTASLRHGSSVEKSVRFGEESSNRSPDRFAGFQPRPLPGMNDDIDERDSEDPD